MPRVLSKKAQTRRWTTRDKRIPEGKVLGELKANRKCGRCGDEIKPGDTYKEWSFRYGGTHYRCNKPQCSPRASELTQSKMSTVYAAQEDMDLSHLATSEAPYEDAKSAVEEFVSQCREVAEEYEEAAEPFGAQGENQERADELNGWLDEVESCLDSVDEQMPECDEHTEDEEYHGDTCEDCKDKRTEWIEEMVAAIDEAVGGCPL